MPIVSQIPDGASSINSESDSDLSELSDDNVSMGSLKAAELESELQSMTPAERAEHETFGKEYNGPLLAEDHAAKLLILMSHASTCPCHHKSEKQKEVSTENTEDENTELWPAGLRTPAGIQITPGNS